MSIVDQIGDRYDTPKTPVALILRTLITLPMICTAVNVKSATGLNIHANL